MNQILFFISEVFISEEKMSVFWLQFFFGVHLYRQTPASEFIKATVLAKFSYYQKFSSA
jgi:hypothetical protein